MIRIRVDDFPQTKGEPQHTLEAFRSFHRELTALIGGKRYLLGVIPKRCTVDDILFLRNETDCEIGMHGIHHDEKQLDVDQNEFPSYITKMDVRLKLLEARYALATAAGRYSTIYMPPRNRIDQRTAGVLEEIGFRWYTSGPETDREVMTRFGTFIHSEGCEYGRTDELLRAGAHLGLMQGNHTLTLHWTWETNIGLNHMRTFLSQIPSEHFVDFTP